MPKPVKEIPLRYLDVRDMTAVEKWHYEQQANENALLACKGPHDFQPCERGKIVKGLVLAYACAHCGGVIGPTSKQWYEQGLRHGQRHK